MNHLEELSMRPATNADRSELTAMMLRSRAYEGRYRSIIENYPVTAAMIEAGEIWVAERANRIIGFYRIDVSNADLDLMFVDDAAQGSGFGRRLFAHMKEQAAAAGIEQVTIVAHPPAADFYRRMGALDVGVSPAKTAEGWDRPILNLAIQQ